jgi:hypothetical protein
MAHKKMVQSLLQVRAHLILCFRAEEKIEMVRDPETKKMLIQPKHSLVGLNGWVPICSKELPFELTASMLFTADAPGIPKPIKLPEPLKSVFQIDRVVDESSGERLAAWAKGGVPASAPAQPNGVEYICTDQVTEISDLVKKHIQVENDLLSTFGSFEKIPASKYAKVLARAKELCGVQ